jgi:hypothetical protein
MFILQPAGMIIVSQGSGAVHAWQGAILNRLILQEAVCINALLLQAIKRFPAVIGENHDRRFSDDS